MKTIVIILIFILSSCSKDNITTAEEKLPPITQVGLKTAGCIINGKLLIPKNTINSLTGYPVEGLKVLTGVNFFEPLLGDDYWSLSIANLQNKEHSYWIYVHLNKIDNGVNQYVVGQSNGSFYADGPNNPQIIVRETYNGISGKTFLSSNNSGTISITRFDSVCSGTFNGTLYNKDNPTEMIEVKDGRFDIKISN